MNEAELVASVKLLAEKVEAVKIMRLEPGDTLVLKHSMLLNDAAWLHLREGMEALFPGHKCVLLDKGLDLDVVRGGSNAEARAG